MVASDGAKLYVNIAGTGPACLFVHGGPGQGSMSFQHMGGDALEAFLTMIYLDQRGSGKSPDATNYHLDRVAEDIEEVRSALGVERLCLIAHSFGGVIALAYATRHPARVSELVLANATLEFYGPTHHRMQIHAIDRLLGRPLTPLPPNGPELDAAFDAAFSAMMKSGHGYHLLTEHLATLKRMTEVDSSYPRSRGFGRAVFDQAAEHPEYYKDYAPATAQVTTPVLVLTSARDWAIGPDEYKRFRFPHQQVTVLDTGHVSYFDANAAFTAAIRAFMKGRSE